MAPPTRQTVTENHYHDFLRDRFSNPVARETVKVMLVKIEVTDPVLSEFF
jgi:hypothetical protein